MVHWKYCSHLVTSMHWKYMLFVVFHISSTGKVCYSYYIFHILRYSNYVFHIHWKDIPILMIYSHEYFYLSIWVAQGNCRCAWFYLMEVSFQGGRCCIYDPVFDLWSWRICLVECTLLHLTYTARHDSDTGSKTYSLSFPLHHRKKLFLVIFFSVIWYRCEGKVYYFNSWWHPNSFLTDSRYIHIKHIT